MIKEYFTDGLISLAILLSLFRTDLLSLNLNNLINYPEVQDIILGQTAAYLPASFHTFQQPQHPNLNLKQIDLFDNNALNSWYQNLNNLLRFRHGRQNEIEAFLVSGSQTQSQIGESLSNNHSSTEIQGSGNITESSAQSLDQSAPVGDLSVTHDESTVLSDVNENNTTLSALNPFPGCNLTKEEIDLIDALWKQDVDLGVGKEVYDPSLREELERERELELLKQEEKTKAQLAAREREERAKQEQAERWLMQNFMRDGETGEWVKLQNNSVETTNDTSVVQKEDLSSVNDSLTLEAALNYISSNIEPNLLSDGQTTTSYQNLPFEENGLDFQETQVQAEPESQHMFGMQDNLEEGLNGLVEYLNMANDTTEPSDLAFGGFVPEVPEYKPDVVQLDVGVAPVLDHNSILFQNATMPMPGMDTTNNFNVSMAQYDFNATTGQQATSPNTSTALDLEDDLEFFNDLPNLAEGDVEQLDLDGIDFLTGLDNTTDMMDETMDLPAFDAMSMMTDNRSDFSVALNGSSPNQDVADDYSGLEGATGGSNLTAEDQDGSYRKFSRLSESSNDSGFAFHGGFSSSSASSTPSSSASSYAGSPAGSQHGNSSTASNDTEHDPHKTGALAHHVAHNHTYNTLPGHVPREVKKYAHKEPSRKGPHSRDQKRASEMKIPFTIDEIIESPVDTFNDMLTKCTLSEGQLALIRDIRRRGKNKVAAQNCRKRKVHVIVSLADELTDLEKARDRLKAEREEMERETRNMKEKFSYLYTHIFQSLRDERGEPYDSDRYSLQQSSDGNVFLVPRNVTANNNNSSSNSHNNHHHKHRLSEAEDKGSKKRKSSDN